MSRPLPTDEETRRPVPDPGRVLVVGGYGAVGVVTTRALAAAYPGRVIVAGRDGNKARRAAAGIAGVHAAALDVTDPAALVDVIERYRVAVVVLAVEPPDSEATRLCLSRGVHVVDLSASAALLEQTEQLRGLAHERGATALLSVGLAPGLTNLLARRVHDELGGDADQLDITVLIGSGERHGADGIRWTVRQLAAPRSRIDAEPRWVELPGYGRRRAHPFPFSDQHTLRRTLSVAHVATTLCFDSRAATALLFGVRRTGLFRAVRGDRGIELLTKILRGIHVGSDGFAVRVDGRRGSLERWQAVTGSQQSRVTGLVAAQVTGAILGGRVPTGVHHIDEIDDFVHLPERLAGDGLRVWRAARPHGREGLDLECA